MTEHLVRLELPSVEAEKSLRRFTGRLPKFGGEVMEVTPPLPEISKPKPQRRVVEPPTERIEDLPFYLLARSIFNSRALQTTSQAHATQTWRCAAGRERIKDGYTASSYHDYDYLDLDAFLWRIRDIESGQKEDTALVTQKRWDIFTGFINERLGEDSSTPLVLPWDEEIHPEFRKYNTSRRLQAAQALQAKYQELEA